MANGELDLSKIWLFSTVFEQGLAHHPSCPRRGGWCRRTASSANRGPSGGEFFLIVKGEASVRRNKRKVATLGPGDYFGELALLDRRPRSATVASETEMKLLVLGQRQFNGVLDAVPALSRKMLAAMATRLREADEKAIANI